jgi:hypothetical protein
VEEITGTKWNRYCNEMMKKGAYVDNYFVQCTAWFLKMDLWILAENGTRSHPFMKISGIEEASSSTPVLFIGLADEHYQSLLPKSSKQVQVEKKQIDTIEVNEMKACPVCGKESNKVLWHLSRTKACKETFGAEKLKEMPQYFVTFFATYRTSLHFIDFNGVNLLFLNLHLL